MEISQDCAVRIHYHLTDADGEVIDSSRGREPLAYLHGHGNLVPGVESALLGLAAGATVTAVVPPDKGYGERNPDLDVAIDPDNFPPEVRSELRPGAMFRAHHPTEDTEVVTYTVVNVHPDRIEATGNHALAGITLHFDLEVVDVRAATEEELAHGHIHGEGGHHH